VSLIVNFSNNHLLFANLQPQAAVKSTEAHLKSITPEFGNSQSQLIQIDIEEMTENASSEAIEMVCVLFG
jgi:hypothetical protein